mgnify:CR=1 FL=1
MEILQSLGAVIAWGLAMLLLYITRKPESLFFKKGD